MQAIWSRLTLALSLFLGAQMIAARSALAHTGEDASTDHMIVEFGMCGLGLAAALGVIILVFWIRNKVRLG